MWLPDNSVFIPVVDPNMAPERTAAELLDVAARLVCFDEVEKTYTEEEARNEASRCLKCPTQWCTNACPAGVRVTDFIAAARKGDFDGAYQIIRQNSMLPEICSRVCPQEKQCQSNCTRSIRSQAVGIGKLERFVVEQHYAAGTEEAAAAPTGKHVAVVGSGPAGLAAAQRLVDKGHRVTVYERADRVGGLMEYGIPNMKLEKGVVARKVASLEAQGVVFVTGVNAGIDVKAEDLTAQYDAVILAVGTGNARSLKLDGAENVRGIIRAVDFLSAATRAVLDGDEPVSAEGKQVVIVGGGDTGSDCVGTALRQRCVNITQVEMLPEKMGRDFIHHARPQRAKESKPDFSQEECAKVFGDVRRYQTTVKSVTSDAEGNLTSVTLVSLEAKYDSNYRLTLTEIADSAEVVPCDLLIIAAGFIGPEGYVAESFGVKTTQQTNIAAEGYVVNGKIFACGDCRTGQSLVVKAMVDGRDCADAVDRYLI